MLSAILSKCSQPSPPPSTLFRSPFRTMGTVEGDAVFGAYFRVWWLCVTALVLIAFSLNGGGLTLDGSQSRWSDASGYALGAPLDPAQPASNQTRALATCAFQATLQGGVFYCTVSRLMAGSTQLAPPGVFTQPCCNYTTSIELQNWWRAWQATGCHEFAESLRCTAIISIKSWSSIFIALLTVTIVALMSLLVRTTEALWQMWGIPVEKISILRVPPVWLVLYLVTALFSTIFVLAAYPTSLNDFLVKLRDETAIFDNPLATFGFTDTSTVRTNAFLFSLLLFQTQAYYFASQLPFFFSFHAPRVFDWACATIMSYAPQSS